MLLLCTLATASSIGMVSIHTGTEEGSAVNRHYEGLSNKWAQLVDKYEKPEGHLSGYVLIPQLAYLGNEVQTMFPFYRDGLLRLQRCSGLGSIHCLGTGELVK